MLDIETLGTTPGAVILSIGAVEFDTTGLGKVFYAAIDIASCLTAGLVADSDTLNWWLQQSPAARADAFRGETALKPALIDFFEWMRITGADRVWANGASFDFPLLSAAYRAAGLQVPWRYSNERCFRTLAALWPVEKVANANPHNALFDARAQAQRASAILAELEGRKA